MAEEQGFKFLNHEDFMRLSPDAKAAYLLRASEELERRQRLIREQIKTIAPKADKRHTG